MSRRPVTRPELLSLLADACELEHGLACSYLYAAFSLKQGLAEGGLTWQQLQKTKRWAAQIYMVAAEEMQHLAQAWNLLAAAGGTPYYARPPFPQSSNYYPLALPMTAAPFGRRTLDAFIAFERPTDLSPAPGHSSDPARDFHSVGELYGFIRSGFASIPGVIVGDRDAQVGRADVDFPRLIEVVDVDSALAGIDEITREGEGTPTDRLDCHHGIFRALRDDFNAEVTLAARTGVPFEPVRPAVENPCTRRDADLRAPGANLLTDRGAEALATTFDGVYQLMLQCLQWTFDNATSDPAMVARLPRLAILAMTMVLKPLGEALMLLPAGDSNPGRTAGPGFGIVRHVALSRDGAVARRLVSDRLATLVEDLRQQLERLAPLAPLHAAAGNLTALRDEFDSPDAPASGNRD
jgi:hypothetical protein